MNGGGGGAVLCVRLVGRRDREVLLRLKNAPDFSASGNSQEPRCLSSACLSFPLSLSSFILPRPLLFFPFFCLPPLLSSLSSSPLLRDIFLHLVSDLYTLVSSRQICIKMGPNLQVHTPPPKSQSRSPSPQLLFNCFSIPAAALSG